MMSAFLELLQTMMFPAARFRPDFRCYLYEILEDRQLPCAGQGTLGIDKLHVVHISYAHAHQLLKLATTNVSRLATSPACQAPALGDKSCMYTLTFDALHQVAFALDALHGFWINL